MGSTGGWNRPAANQPTVKKGGAKAPSKVRGIVAGVLAVAIGVVCWIVFSPSPEADKKEPAKKQGAIQEVTPAPAPKAVEPEKPQKSEAEIAREKENEKIRKMTPEERVDYIFQKQIERPVNLNPSSNQVFATGTEQILSQMFTKQLGDPPPPLPAISINDEAHLAEIIINSVKPEEGDSEKTKFAKEQVELAKRELAAYIKEGGDIHQFLKFYHDKLAESYMQWKDAQALAIKSCREDPDIAVTYIKEINKKLADKGIKNVMIPPGLKQQIGYTDDDE